GSPTRGSVGAWRRWRPAGLLRLRKPRPSLSAGRLASRARSGHRRDVSRHGGRVRAGHDLGRHQTGGSGMVDLVVDDLLDRALPKMLFLRAGEGTVQIGADRPARSRVRKTVATAAF